MDEVAQVKERLDVAEVLGSYLELKQSGRNLKASCPFHHEKTASFMVSPEKNIWHCFGCGEGGDIFKFVMKMEGLDFPQALEKLARQAGVELKARGRGPSSQLKDRLFAAAELAAKYYQVSLTKNPRALEYLLKQRQLTRETVLAFRLGYAPEDWTAVSDFLRKKGFTPQEINQAGLANTGGRSGLYDLFRGRVMFPVLDAQDRPVGFSARVLDAAASGGKYINTPQTPIYDKSRVIFGLSQARDAIRENDEVVLVEGNMDVISSHQAGAKQVIAASGTALTLEQLKALGRLTKNIKLAFDQDAAGLVATERAIELSQKLGLNLRVVAHSAKDPDELIKKDVTAWQKAIKEAPYVIDYLFERFSKEYDLASALGKKQFSDRLAPTLRRLADAVEKDHYLQLLAEKIGGDMEAVKAKVEAATAKPTKEAVTPPTPQRVQKKSSQELVEEALLALNLVYPETRISLDDLRAEDFDHPDRQTIFTELIKGKAKADEIAKLLPDKEDYVKILSLRGEEEFASLAPADRSFEAFSLAKRLIALSRHKTKTQISQKLKAAEAAGDLKLASELLKQYQAIIAEDF
jgi:DNA primase